MVDLRESLHISFDYRVSRPKSLATRLLHALLQILENWSATLSHFLEYIIVAAVKKARYVSW